MVKNLAEGLLKTGALQFGTFTLPDGRDTPYYINLHALPSFPGAYSAVVDALAGVIRQKVPKAGAVCAVSFQGLFFAAPVAIALKRPLLYTKGIREPGGKSVEGEVRPDWRVVAVNDLAESGESILAAAEAVTDEGGELRDAVVLIDRLEGAREKLHKKGIALHAVVDVIELGDALLSMDLISESDIKAITRSVGRAGQVRRK